VRQDVPPYVTVSGHPAKPAGTNSEGLRRRGFTADQIAAVRRAYKTLYREERSLEDAREALARAAVETPLIAPLAAFLGESSRGIVR
jgi:UDP-N-acetylglucosamine acyltransferase